MIYIHIPFCKSRCIYCDFFSSTLPVEWQKKYISALEREVSCRTEEIKFAGADTIYLGGGTPSVLSGELLEYIFTILNDVCDGFHETIECTIEVNPDDVSAKLLNVLHRTPVNRISMGVQSLNNDILRRLGRRHTKEAALDSLKKIQETGYNNISVDLMYGLPGQTLSGWEDDVDEIIGCGANHLSAYALQVETGTVIEHYINSGELQLPCEEDVVSMYESLIRIMGNNGWEHYEISNFAKPGYRARHNSGYWQGMPYVGLGPGAHSYDSKNVRRSNCCDLEMYCNNVTVPCEKEILTEQDRLNEIILTRLRTSDGLQLNLLPKEMRESVLSVAKAHIARNTLIYEQGVLRLTEKGFFISNDIISDFML